jgi:hypothetical protein
VPEEAGEEVYFPRCISIFIIDVSIAPWPHLFGDIESNRFEISQPCTTDRVGLYHNAFLPILRTSRSPDYASCRCCACHDLISGIKDIYGDRLQHQFLLIHSIGNNQVIALYKILAVDIESDDYESPLICFLLT